MGPSKVGDDQDPLGSQAGDLRKLFLPVRVRGPQQPKAKQGTPLGSSASSTPAVLSELLVSAPGNPGLSGGAWDLQGTNVLVVTGNPGVVDFYAEYMAALRGAVGSSVNAIVCLCHAGHSGAAPRKPAPYAFSMQQQIEHKVEFLSHAAQYLAAASESPNMAEAQGRWWEAAHKAEGEASPKAGERWIIIGHSIGAHISLEVQKCMRRLRPAAEVEDAQATRSFPVIGLYPFLRANRESAKQRNIDWVTHATLLCMLGGLLLHIVRLLLPRPLLRRLLQANMGKNWSPAAISVTMQYMMLYHVFRNHTYLAKTEFDDFERTPLDWAWLQSNTDSCTFVFGLTDHWGPMSLYHDMRARVPALRVQLDEEGHPHNFCCTVAGSKSIAQLTAHLCMLSENGFVDKE